MFFNASIVFPCKSVQGKRISSADFDVLPIDESLTFTHESSSFRTDVRNLDGIQRDPSLLDQDEKIRYNSMLWTPGASQ